MEKGSGGGGGGEPIGERRGGRRETGKGGRDEWRGRKGVRKGGGGGVNSARLQKQACQVTSVSW